MDCNVLVGVHLPTVDTCWWATNWDRRDVLLVWMGFWGRYTGWRLIYLLSLLLPRSQWVKMGMVRIGHEVLLVQHAKSGSWGVGLDGFLEWDLGT